MQPKSVIEGEPARAHNKSSQKTTKLFSQTDINAASQ
jgi:hypothetical protein